MVGAASGRAFPEIVAGAAQLPDAIALVGELIVWNAAGHLAFEQLQNRLHRRSPAALLTAGQRHPARWHRIRTDLAPTDALGMTSPR
jgi:ATP-dependent DNA ligase